MTMPPKESGAASPTPTLLAACLTGLSLLTATVGITFGMLVIIVALERNRFQLSQLWPGVAMILFGAAAGALLWAGAWIIQRLHDVSRVHRHMLRTLDRLVTQADAARRQPPTGSTDADTLAQALTELRQIRALPPKAIQDQAAEPPNSSAPEPAIHDHPPATAAPQAHDIAGVKRRIEDLMSVEQFCRAEQVAQSLLTRYPHSPEVHGMLETVRREAGAFHAEQQSRLYNEIQRYTQARQWRKAIESARRLLEKYPASQQAQRISATLSTIENNAKLEEIRDLRNRFRDLVARKRFAEAVEIAEDVGSRFPDAKIAGELRRQIPHMKRRSR